MSRSSSKARSVRRPALAAAAWLSTALLCTCSSMPRFDADQAFALLVKQTELGPRVPGSPAHAQALTFFAEYLRERAGEVLLDSFTFTDSLLDSTLQLCNVVARFGAAQGDRILLGAHFDSRPRSDQDPDTSKRDLPLLGANDGASGVAVLLALADLMKPRPPSIGVDLVLFDGEDWGQSGHLDYYCLGAKHYASRLRAGAYRYVVVIDMIGDKDQQVNIEGYSHSAAAPVVEMIWDAAARLGITTFSPAVKYTVYDDHVPFLLRGIPAVVLIDFDYPYWHTTQDTPAQCSPASLGNVGKILVALLYP